VVFSAMLAGLGSPILLFIGRAITGANLPENSRLLATGKFLMIFSKVNEKRLINDTTDNKSEKPVFDKNSTIIDLSFNLGNELNLTMTIIVLKLLIGEINSCFRPIWFSVSFGSCCALYHLLQLLLLHRDRALSIASYVHL
jgi:hypothetical protein